MALTLLYLVSQLPLIQNALHSFSKKDYQDVKHSRARINTAH
jgi:hypothetical protein